ncbi:MAG: glycosyltransferase family 4 protein [Chloroflexi bacterium]|nr:glycosyltransferase family 4 protein [Chloroflexota bacterium]
MRVAFIHPFLFRYARGIERYTLNLANALVQSGIQPHLITWRWPSPVTIESLGPRVETHLLFTSRFYASKVIVPFYLAHLLRWRYDFVWIYFAGYGEAETLALMRNQRYGIVFHYPYEQVPHRYREFRRYGLARRAERIVAVSQLVADGVREALGRESDVISHGVDGLRFHPDVKQRERVRRELGLPSDAHLLVTTAALEKRKGIQHVLGALPLVMQRAPQTYYVVAGDGPDRTFVEQTVGALPGEVSTHVRLVGAQQNVVPYLQAADLFLILARGEASSLAALEALACGVPVIASRSRPFDELIRAEYGAQLDETNHAVLAETVVSLLNDPARRRQMGETGRACMLQSHTWAQVAQDYVKLMQPDALQPG